MSDCIAIAKRLETGEWTAWFFDDPDVVFRGRTAGSAACLLTESRGLLFEVITRVVADGIIEYGLTYAPCANCKGSGKYQGLNVAEDCNLCRGTGRGDTVPTTMTQSEVLGVLRDRCVSEGWSYEEPIYAEPRGQPPRWLIHTAAHTVGGNVFMEIDDATQEVVRAFYTPM